MDGHVAISFLSYHLLRLTNLIGFDKKKSAVKDVTPFVTFAANSSQPSDAKDNNKRPPKKIGF